MPYDHKQIEKKWAKKWEEKGVYKLDPKALSERSESKWYNLMMFPYPSAEGLHVGNMYAFTGADFYGRFQAMQGKTVFEPIGLDGFGIHSENYALKIKKHPVELATVSQ
ncbi:MAG TPA: class I tRNA ligase family protein, partial [Patescibacteria group bacterium]|nr:class I tRNA ligase family protein [Patescibacteria group bacterium]